MDKSTKKYKDFISIIKVLEIFSSVLIIISSIVFLVLAGTPLISKIFNKWVSREIEAKGFGFTFIINGKLENKFPGSYFIVAHLSGCITMMIFILILLMIRSILKDILKSQEPFIKLISKKLRIISIAMLILTVVEWIGEAIAYVILTNEQFLSTKISGIKFSSSVNFSFSLMFISCFVYLLSYIIEYGAELKEDNDGII